MYGIRACARCSDTRLESPSKDASAPIRRWPAIEDYKYPAGRFYEIYFLFHGESLNQINVYDEVRKADLKNYHREIAEHQFLFMFTLTSSSWCNTKLLGLSICAQTCPRVTHVYLVAIRLIVTAEKLSSDAGRKKAK